jgi:hypothetical protein
MRRERFIDALMAEHIQMPGCPDLIVTRAEAWHFLTSLGYREQARSGYGFDTVDYMVMNPRQRALTDPLSPPEVRERVFAAMRANA